jgi:hypothetical protein
MSWMKNLLYICKRGTLVLISSDGNNIRNLGGPYSTQYYIIIYYLPDAFLVC